MYLNEMSLYEYQTAAATTALPTAFDHQYLIPGILSEVGEVYGKLAKAHRDTWPAKTLREEIVKEYGDICWPTAILLKMHGVEHISPSTVSDAQERLVGLSPISAIDVAFRHVLHQAVALERAERTWRTTADHRPLLNEAERLWVYLELLAPVVTGENFDYVLGVNILKLQSRKLRGVLEGSGDDR